jgi:hypothetical protein
VRWPTRAGGYERDAEEHFAPSEVGQARSHCFADRLPRATRDHPAAAVALTVGAAGGATVRTTVLLTPEQVDEAAKRSVDYTPPGLITV